MPEAPEHYQNMLTKLGGMNPLGEPMFRLVWGSSPIPRKIAGNPQYVMPFDFMAVYQNHWVLVEWTPPEEFGAPSLWDEKTYGPYPEQGLYQPRVSFVDDGVPRQIDTEYLNLEVLRLLLHVIVTHKYDSEWKRYTTLKEDRAKKKAEEFRVLVDRIEDGAPAFADAVSFSGQRNVNSVIKQKMESLEKNYDRIVRAAKRFPRGGMVASPAR